MSNKEEGKRKEKYHPQASAFPLLSVLFRNTSTFALENAMEGLTASGIPSFRSILGLLVL
jgi:hypothetical protein